MQQLEVPPPKRLPDVFAAFALFLLTWATYTLAPATWVYDSHHTLLAAEQLYRHGDFQLNEYFPELEPRNQPGEPVAREPSTHLLCWVNGDLYYSFPPGSSILSIPFLPLFHLSGHSVVGPDDRPVFHEEQDLQKSIAALLTALFVLLVFWMARDVLSVGWSTFIALVIALGTMALSTASRGVWSHTWGILLLATAIWICWKRSSRSWTPMTAILVGTLLSWCFLVRPTFALSAAGIAVFVALVRVRWWWLLPVVGLGWLVVFSAYSWIHWGTWLPGYFFASRLHLNSLGEALAGNLVSPSRGLLVFTPGLLCWVYFAFAYSRSIPRRRWMTMATSLVVTHWLLVSAFPHGQTYGHWFAGHCFGPRLMTDVLPWLALVGVLATKAWLDGSQSIRRRRIELVALLLLWGVSVAIHFTGAVSSQTQSWNAEPGNIDLQPARVWDWADPQFLRPLRPYDDGYSALVTRLTADGTLKADVYEISIGHGGTQKLTLDAGEAHADRSYWILGSVTGTEPGVPLVSRVGAVNIPLRPDHWTDYTIALPNTKTLVHTKGRLDDSGRAQASFNLPKAHLPDAIGVTFYHAYVVYDADNNFYMASNPVPLRLR